MKWESCTLLVLGIWRTGCLKVHLRLSVWERNWSKSSSVCQFCNTILSMLHTQVIQLQKQLDIRFFSTCYYTQPEVDTLTRRNRLVMNCYSFLGHKYSFFNAIVSRLITLKILKSQNVLDLLVPESPPGLRLRSQAAKTIASQSLFLLIKLNLLPKNGHRLTCLDKYLYKDIWQVKITEIAKVCWWQV